MRSLLIEIGRRAGATPPEAGTPIVTSRWLRVFWFRGSLAQQIAHWTQSLLAARGELIRRRDKL